MSALWSTTKSAVNTGYGMMNFGRIGLPNPFYKPAPLGKTPLIHPELLMDPPYSQDTPQHKLHVRGGSSLIKGSESAKARMAYIRSLRGKKRRVHGGSGLDSLSAIATTLGGTVMNAIQKLAANTGASLTELFADPASLINGLMTFAPFAARAVKKLFGKDDDDDVEPPIIKKKSERRKYLEKIKKTNPELYEQLRRKAMQRKKQTTSEIINPAQGFN